MASNGSPNNWKNRHFYQALKFALVGLVTAYQEERNVRFHTLAVILVEMLGWYFKVSGSEWLWIVRVDCQVIWSENLNTVLDNVVD